MDNLMGLFDQIIDKYQRKSVINAVLKSNGFDYILVGFNVATIDNTPEKSIVQKYNRLMSYLSVNEGLELVATDRIIEQNLEGSKQQVFGVFGQISYTGSYAVYRIK
jgi:hypothetical protein